MKPGRCSDCRYWEKFEDDKNEGYCRRFPPVRDRENDQFSYAGWDFPVTISSDWCGEWGAAISDSLPMLSDSVVPMTVRRAAARRGVYTLEALASGECPGAWGDIGPARIFKTCLALMRYGILPAWYPIAAGYCPRGTDRQEFNLLLEKLGGRNK